MSFKLTAEQQQVVDHTLGPALVFAVAGAGKTTAMVHRIEKLVREKVFPPQRILATSFGRSNVRDLREALAAWPHCQAVEVRTLHSLGYLIIRRAQQEGYLSNLAISDGNGEPGSVEQQLISLAQGMARQLNLPFVPEMDSLDRQDFLDYVGSCKSNLLYANLAAAELPRAGLVKAGQAEPPDGALSWYLDLYRLYEELRQQRGQITYDDMLLTGWEVLVKYPEVLDKVQQAYECVLVDEFQDVNKAQSEILDLITQDQRNYMTIGDDDQTIYEWRGAGPDYILNFQKRYNAQTYLIADNFRCPAAPLVLANQVIAHNKKRQPKRLSLTQGFRGQAKVYFDPDVPLMARRLVGQIQLALVDGFSLDDMAILVRLNAQTPHIEQNLIAAGIPYRVSHPFYDRPEIKTLIDYCRLAWVEQQMVAGDGKRQGAALGRAAARSWFNIANRPKRYIAKNHRDQIGRAMQSGGASPSEVLMEYAQLVQEDWLFDNLEALATEIDSLAKELDNPAGITLANLDLRLGYKEFLRDSSGFAQTGEALAASVAAFIDYAGGYGTLFSFMKHVRELADSKAGKATSGSDPAVTISTIHRAKGLEWPLIFVPQCNEGILPFLSEYHNNNNLEEERRLFYVAITRTRHSLYLYCVRDAPLSQFLEQAGWQAALNSVNKLEEVLAKAPGRWLAEDALLVARSVVALNLQRYFELWWDAPAEQKREVAQTMQRFYDSVEQNDLNRSLRLPAGGVALWSAISPPGERASAYLFPGLERYLPRTAAQAGVAGGQKGQTKDRLSGGSLGHAVSGVGRPISRPAAKTREGQGSLNQGMHEVRNQGKVATDEAIQGLVKNLAETNSVIRYMSRSELRRIGGLRVVEALGKSLKSGDVSRTRLDESRKLLTLLTEIDPDPAAQERARAVLARLAGGDDPAGNQQG